MKYRIAVEDSIGNESLLEFNSPNISEARLTARNIHIFNHKLKYKLTSCLPEIWTFLEETSEETI